MAHLCSQLLFQMHYLSACVTCCGDRAIGMETYLSAFNSVVAISKGPKISFIDSTSSDESQKKSGKVVVDNDHLQTETRNAVDNGIKRKLPGTVFQCYHFVPQYGELQCLWYLQWMLCRKFLFDINSEIPKLQDHSSNLKMSVALFYCCLVLKQHDSTNMLTTQVYRIYII